jgi:multidrug efflux pump subunit AcrA (membrane-fusion protein)
MGFAAILAGMSKGIDEGLQLRDKKLAQDRELQLREAQLAAETERNVNLDKLAYARLGSEEQLTREKLSQSAYEAQIKALTDQNKMTLDQSQFDTKQKLDEWYKKESIRLEGERNKISAEKSKEVGGVKPETISAFNDDIRKQNEVISKLKKQMESAKSDLAWAQNRGKEDLVKSYSEQLVTLESDIAEAKAEKEKIARIRDEVSGQRGVKIATPKEKVTGVAPKFEKVKPAASGVAPAFEKIRLVAGDYVGSDPSEFKELIRPYWAKLSASEKTRLAPLIKKKIEAIASQFSKGDPGGAVEPGSY